MRSLILAFVVGVVSSTPGAQVAGTFNLTGNTTKCTLNGASPSTCTVAAPSQNTAVARCVCWPLNGNTAAIAAGGCTGQISGANFQAFSANGLSNDVLVFCDQ